MPAKPVKSNVVLERLVVEYVPVDSIRPNTYNPNRQSDHDFELLLRSMDEDGFTQPIVCNRETREFVDGEHRWTAAIVLHYLKTNGMPITAANGRAARDRRLEIIDGSQEIPVVFTDMTAEQMRIATLRHNRARGSEDVELTAAVLRDLQRLGALDWAQDSLQIDDDEVNRLINDVPAPEALAAADYGTAWVPTETTVTDEPENLTTQGVERPAKGGHVTDAMSLQAVEAVRRREAAVALAKNDEERRMAQESESLYRVQLTFAGEEANLVRSVLGSQPAVRLVELCRAAKEE